MFSAQERLSIHGQSLLSRKLPNFLCCLLWLPRLLLSTVSSLQKNQKPRSFHVSVVNIIKNVTSKREKNASLWDFLTFFGYFCIIFR